MTCHNCGLPEGALTCAGFNLKIVIDRENKMQRMKKTEVWCCSEECAWQAYAISMMGLSTHRWPIKLAEFKERNGSVFKSLIQAYGNGSVSDRKDTTENSLSTDGAVVGHSSLVRGVGRPKQWKSEADRVKAYRDKKRAQRLQAGCRAEI